MTVFEIVAYIVAAVTIASKYLGVTKDLWSKVPVLAHYAPGFLVVAAVVGEKLAGVQTTNDLVSALVALGLLAFGHFTKPAATK